LIVGEIVLSVILSAAGLSYGWRSFISNLVVDTLVVPFIAAVLTLIYYRLTTAHGGQPEPGQSADPAWPAPYGQQGPSGQPGQPGQYGQPGPYGQQPPADQPPAGPDPAGPGSFGPNPYGGTPS